VGGYENTEESCYEAILFFSVFVTDVGCGVFAKGGEVGGEGIEGEGGVG
jgi:hypothetical protein